MVVLAALVPVFLAVSTAAPGDSLTDLKSAIDALQSKQTARAIGILKSVKIPLLADYAGWFLGSAQFDTQQYAEVPKALEAVWAQTPPSPLIARSALLAARAYQATNDSHRAVEILRKYYDKLPQPQGDLALASGFAGDGDPVSAAVYNQRVYFGYPASNEADSAAAEIVKLKAQLGDQYPPALGTAMLGRATKLLDLGQIEKARRELTAMIPELAGADRDTAQVRIGEADYLLKKTSEAQRYLTDLSIESPEADAERLYYLALCQRRGKDRDAMKGALGELEKRYPQSRWRLDALVGLANLYLVDNQVEDYEPLYRACFESFPKDPRADECHWKITVQHYLKRSEDAGDLLRVHLKTFPASDESPAALYFLARLADEAGDSTSARAYYTEIIREYPNHYHATLARGRMSEAKVIPAVAADSGEAAAFLKTVAFPQRARVRSFEPNKTAKARLERARALASAGLDDWAEGELRYAAQNEDQPHVMALELASTASRRYQPERALRYVKRYAADYLYLPIESAPMEFWKLAFPMPYRAEIERWARQNDLDPYFLAALIRQESEFDPKAISVSSARGLTQILPGTGRELSRSLKLRPYSTARLYQPSINLQIGAYYLKTISQRFDGRLDLTLAAYNAGPGRASAWLKWGEFHDPAEFIEAVPFTQTRNYVEIVLRNADLYRRIYSQDSSAPIANASAPSPGPRVSYTSDGIDQRKKSSRPAGAH